MKTLTIGAVPHSYDGSSYYRIWLPFKHLDDQSHHITGVLPPGGKIPGPQDIQGLDVLTFQRPAGKEGARMLERLVGQGTKLVYEVDDDMLNVDSSGLPHLADDRSREAIRRCLRLCDMVTTTNEYLADTVRPYNDNIRILPNHVKAGLLDLPKARKPNPELVTIGWAGGTSHLVDMVEIADVLRYVLEGERAEAHFIGFDFSPLLADVRGRARWTRWEQDVGAYYKHIDFDIAIAPSADIPFNRGKTWIRALEMGAMGVPIVASNRLPYSDYVVDGKTGFLVNSPGEWEARLRDLINQPEMRAEMGAAAKEQAAGWTIEDGWVRWQQAYESAVDEE
jgi:glycosyltransferase involved in cell wall biosynthesis